MTPAEDADGEGLDDVIARLLGLVTALRRAGAPVGPATTIDAVAALKAVDLADRRQLRAALAAVLVSGPSYQAVFDDLFALWFPPGVTRADSDEATFSDRLAEALDADDDHALQQLADETAERFGQIPAQDGTPAYYHYRAARAVDTLAAELGQRSDDTLDTPHLVAFRRAVDQAIRRRNAEAHGRDAVAERLVAEPLVERDLLRLDPGEQDALRAEIAVLVQRLARRLAVRRQRARQGRLDIRRTVRRSLATGGVPFTPVFRRRRPHRPDLVVLADVSGSVAAFARFTLLFLHALQGEHARVRSFAFIDTVDEITEALDTVDVAAAVDRVIREARVVAGAGHSDYGAALADFHTRVDGELPARATVLVLGDARTNHHPPRAHVLAELRRQVSHVYWLNPEPRAHWNTGDSV
ncbi:MAG: VWA domain-containing protein, partial [Nitriliruptoraceae bacterium]